MTLQSKRILRIVLIVVAILLVPFIATQLSDEVNWALSDFIIMGSVLLAVGFAYEFVAGKSEKTVYKAAFGVGLLGAFLLFWVNGAVGIIGNEGQPANLLYIAVFVVGLAGALLARFKAPGMARTLYAAAITQMLVPTIALLIWPPPATSWSPSIFGVFLLSAFFAVLFLVAALLFRRSAQIG